MKKETDLLDDSVRHAQATALRSLARWHGRLARAHRELAAGEKRHGLKCRRAGQAEAHADGRAEALRRARKLERAEVVALETALAAERAHVARLRANVEALAPYAESATTRSYDGTNGHGIRQEAERRLDEARAALAATPADSARLLAALEAEHALSLEVHREGLSPERLERWRAAIVAVEAARKGASQ